MVYTNGSLACKRATFVARCIGVTLTVATAASPALGSSTGRVRSSNPAVLQLIAEAAERSATFRGLLEQIERSDGIVYVEFGYCAFGRLNGCMLPWVVPSTGGRYLRVQVTPDRARVDHERRIAIIAHELQHALEVLAHREVFDAETMRAMYARIGMPIAASHAYETTAAFLAEDAVFSELAAHRPHR
jgi:hypothetical protein